MQLLTPLYAMLVFLEDRGKIDSSGLQSWGKNSSRGIIGKMEAMGLVDRNVINSSVEYSLSRKGFQFLNSILDVIHRGIVHWDGKWRLLCFSIPEERRPLRDKFRRFIESLGLRPFLGGLWITPLDCKKELIEHASRLGISNFIAVAETCEIFGQDTQKIIAEWKFDKYRGLYEEFISESEILLRSGNASRFEVKKMILNYALILNNEPNMPIELLPQDWPKFRANLQYKKLKRVLG